jgi:hypothetical protein
VTHVKAREWIKRLPERAGDDVDAGCKGLLQAMWDHILWEIEHTTTGTSREPGHSCWASAETLAGEIGSTERAVSDRQGKLSKAGWIRRDGRGWAMAWAVPFTPECRAKKRTRKHRSVTDSTPECLATSTAVSDEQHRGVTKRTHEPSNQPSNEPPQRAGEPAPVEGHPCTVADSPEVTPARVEPDDPNQPSPPPIGDSPPPASESAADPPRPSPPRARRRRPPEAKRGQVRLDLPDAPEPDAVAELLAEHERLRQAAQRAHGMRETALPSPSSGDGHSLRLRLRKAVDAHGAEVCRRALGYRGREWAEDPGALARWSTDSMWSPKSLATSIPASAGQAQARASPSRRDPAPLSCEPSGLQMPRIVIDPNAKCL